MRLLLCEDERAFSDALCAILEHNNYTVDAVYDGEDAYAYGLSDNYDGILLDIMMPKADGLTVLQKLRAAGVQTPVLLLTAKSEVEDRVTGLNLGADDYLPKPFVMAELLARVRALTRRQGEYRHSTLQFGDLQAQPVDFLFFLKRQVRRRIAVIADAEFLPLCHAVYLFAQRYVVAVVEIQAVDTVSAVRPDMRVALHQAAEPRAQLVIIGVGNLVFAFVPIVFFFLHICVSPPGYGYRIQFFPKTNLNVMCFLHGKRPPKRSFSMYRGFASGESTILRVCGR